MSHGFYISEILRVTGRKIAFFPTARVLGAPV